jgi:hypothetical protein
LTAVNIGVEMRTSPILSCRMKRILLELKSIVFDGRFRLRTKNPSVKIMNRRSSISTRFRNDSLIQAGFSSN